MDPMRLSRRITTSTAIGVAAAALALSTVAPAGAATTQDENPYGLLNPDRLTVCKTPAAKKNPSAPSSAAHFLSTQLVAGYEDEDFYDPPIKYVTVSSADLRSGEAFSKCDIAIGNLKSNSGGVDTTPDFENASLSTPYLQEKLILMTSKGSGITSVDKVAKTDRVAVQKDTAAAAFAKKKGLRTLTYSTPEEVLESLHTGTTQAAIGNYTSLGHALATSDYHGIHTTPALKTVQQFDTGTYYSVAVRGDDPGHEALARKVDESFASGEFSARHMPWSVIFSGNFADVGNGPTTDALIQ
jgi:polar amino acid transport system substrate-binding protein